MEEREGKQEQEEEKNSESLVFVISMTRIRQKEERGRRGSRKTIGETREGMPGKRKGKERKGKERNRENRGQACEMSSPTDQRGKDRAALAQSRASRSLCPIYIK
eukprot:763160-Hanusia_phi.AAC.1